MYYIEKLNNDEYPLNRKRLSVKYGLSVPTNPWILSIHYKKNKNFRGLQKKPMKIKQFSSARANRQKLP
jgi:hypothetical protein